MGDGIWGVYISIFCLYRIGITLVKYKEMKKLLLILIIVFAGINCQAQVKVHYTTHIEKEGWLYTVSWCIINLIECDRTSIDEFGRVHYRTTLEYCVEAKQDCGHEKTFINKDTAFMFYKRALKEVPDTSKLGWMFDSDGGLIGVKIDSLWSVVNDSIIWTPPLLKK
jgi:hypothetical protein